MSRLTFEFEATESGPFGAAAGFVVVEDGAVVESGPGVVVDWFAAWVDSLPDSGVPWRPPGGFVVPTLSGPAESVVATVQAALVRGLGPVRLRVDGWDPDLEPDELAPVTRG